MPAAQLAIYRRKKGLTQEQLAELSGVTVRTIQRIEKGAVVPHIQTLKLLARGLDIAAELLMDDPEGNSPGAHPVKKNTVAPLFHLAALLGLGFPVFNVILPFVWWVIKKDEDPDYDRQGRQVIDFHLSMSLLFFPAIILMIYFFPAGFPLTMLIYLFMVVMTLINLFRSLRLIPVKYPLSFHFLRI